MPVNIGTERRGAMRKIWIIAVLSFITWLPADAQTTRLARDKCASMANVVLPNAKVSLAEWVSAGKSSALPEAKSLSALYQKLPPFCRVVVRDRPSSNSDIKIEIWLPAAGWNGRYRGQGNGGFAGAIGYWALAAAVREGYATAGTDTGHTDSGHMGLDASFALDHPEKVKDFGWRAIHEMTLKAKAITAAYYGKQPKHSYFASCSDGVRDGVLNDPRACRFDPATMLCKHDGSDSCLLPAQIKTLKNIYAGPHDAADKQIFPGYLPGAEGGSGGWIPWITRPAPHEGMMFVFGTGYFSNFVYEKRDWNYQTYTVDQGVKLADKKTALALNATDTNLKPFFSRGGKLILYHGWDDPAIPAISTINYYNGVVSTVGKKGVDSSLRLYMVPGMHHCGGGPGATDFGQDPAAARGDAQHDVFTALKQWVENGSAPKRLIARKFVAGDPPKA